MKRSLKIGGHEIIASFGSQDIAKYFSGAVDKSTLDAWISSSPEKHLKFRRYYQNLTKEAPGGIYDKMLENRAFIETETGTFSFEYPVDNYSSLMTTDDWSHQTSAGHGGDIAYIELNRELQEGTTVTPYVESPYSIMIDGDAVPTGTGFLHTFKVVGTDFDSIPANFLRPNEEWVIVSHGVGEFGTKFATPLIGDAPSHVKAQFSLGSVTGVEATLTDDANRGAIEGIHGRELNDRLENFKRSNNLGDFLARLDLKVGENGEKPIADSANLGTTLESMVHATLDQMLARRILYQRAGKVKTMNGVVVFNDGILPQLQRAFTISYGRHIGIEHLAIASDHLYSELPDIPKDQRELTIDAAEQAYNNLLVTFEKYLMLTMERNAALLGAERVVEGIVTGSIKDLVVDTPRVTTINVPTVGKVTLRLDTSLGREFTGNRGARGFRSTNRGESSYYAIVSRTSNHRTIEAELPSGVTLAEGADVSSTAFIVKRPGPLVTYGTIQGRMGLNRDYIQGGGVVASYKERSMQFWAYGTADVFIPFPQDMVLLRKETSRNIR